MLAIIIGCMIGDIFELVVGLIRVGMGYETSLGVGIYISLFRDAAVISLSPIAFLWDEIKAMFKEGFWGG